MIYITGDTHGDFRNVARFCEKMQTNKDDVLIILGDAGINYYGGEQDTEKKEYLETLPITIFAIHGNHEMRPQTIPTYHEAEWNGGTVYMEDEYPHILFAKHRLTRAHREKQLKMSCQALHNAPPNRT